MNVGIILKTAYTALKRNRLRSGLTMLGIIIGVAAVIVMISVGQGAKSSVETQIASMGVNILFIGPGSMSTGGQRLGFGAVQTLTPGDADAITRECPSVLAASPSLTSGGQLIYGNQNWSTSIIGASPSYFTIRDWVFEAGQPFSDADVNSAVKVCVLGHDVYDNLFPDGENPIGKTIRVRSVPCKIVGLLKAKGQAGMGQNQDDAIFIPYTSLMKRILNRNYIQFILVSAVSQARMQAAQDEISALLRQRHKIKPGADDDFFVRSQNDMTAMATQTSTILTLLLGSVASISLIVGGIGIMNIMLVSVRERTREIGIRMAVGAKGSDIMMQFLVESIVLSVLGGFIGIVLGVGGSQAVSYFAQWPTYISPVSIVLAIGFSSGIGVFFGFYPARTAAQLNPIDALRYE